MVLAFEGFVFFPSAQSCSVSTTLPAVESLILVRFVSLGATDNRVIRASGIKYTSTNHRNFVCRDGAICESGNKAVQAPSSLFAPYLDGELCEGQDETLQTQTNPRV